MPEQFQVFLHRLTLKAIAASLGNRYCYHLHFTDGEQGTAGLTDLSNVTHWMAALGFEPRHLAPESVLKSPLHYTARPCNRLPSKLASFLDIDAAWNHKHTITPLPLKILFILSLHQPRRLGSPPSNCGSDEGSACDWPPSSTRG